MTIDEIRRNQEKKEKELREQREREKSEAEAFEMARILWGLDEVWLILRNQWRIQDFPNGGGAVLSQMGGRTSCFQVKSA